MGRNKLRNRQKTLMSTKMRLVVGASIFVAASMLLIIVFNLGEVKDTRAFSSGDYKSVSSGDWSDAASWQVFDGKDWSEAAMPPGPGVKSVVISDNSHVTLTDEIAVSNLIIDEGSTLTIDANTVKISKMNDKGSFVCNGTLNLGSAIVEGDADLIIGSKATINIGADGGIDKKGVVGNFQLTGRRELSKDASYVFNGTVKQHTGNGLPAMLKYLIIDNSSGVELDQNLMITDKLTLKRGVVYTGKYSISIGVSSTSPGEVSREEGAVSGKFKRWYGPSNSKDVSFPVSDGDDFTTLSFATEDKQFESGLIETIYHEGMADDSKKSPFEVRHIVTAFSEKGYYTAFLSNGPDEAWLKIGTVSQNKKNENLINWKITVNNKSVKTIEKSGKKAPSIVVKTENFQNILCGPNPFREKFIVRFYSETATSANLQLMNGSGQIVMNETINAEAGNNQFQFEDEKQILPGVYMLRISNASEIHTQKLGKGK